MYRIILATTLAIIAGLTVTSVVLLTAAAHDKPLHRAYSCEFVRNFRQEVHLQPTPCQT